MQILLKMLDGPERKIFFKEIAMKIIKIIVRSGVVRLYKSRRKLFLTVFKVARGSKTQIHARERFLKKTVIRTNILELLVSLECLSFQD